MTAVIYAVFCVALHYLGYWAEITRPLHSRYPALVAEWAGCAACSGFWYGLACGAVGAWARLPLLGLPGRSVAAVALAGAWGMVLTPPLAWALLRALEGLDEAKERAWERAEAARLEEVAPEPAAENHDAH